MGIINQDEINAANAGNCEFYVTMGLLRRANDEQLRGVLAHELAHQDLGDVAESASSGRRSWHFGGRSAAAVSGSRGAGASRR